MRSLGIESGIVKNIRDCFIRFCQTRTPREGLAFGISGSPLQTCGFNRFSWRAVPVCSSEKINVSTSTVDVLIVGAGPGGSTAATALSALGHSVAIIDKAIFPRHKTCASWINALAFSRFPYLRPELPNLVDCPFHGIRFYDESISRHGEYNERKPSGYLTLRSKFDHGLARVAAGAGAQFHEGVRAVRIEEDKTGITAELSNGSTIRARFLVGADGSNSQIARWSGLRSSWRPDEYVLCANEDIPYSSSAIERFYGERFPLFVSLRFNRLDGYGWVFPKRDYICVGIGGRVPPDADIRAIMSAFVERAREVKLIPLDLQISKPHYALDPAGAVHKMETLTKGRTILIGDAAGFVSGSTGEGIYPAMVSGAIAADVIHEALDKGSPDLSAFNERWREELGGYLRALPGGQQKTSTVSRIDLIFRSRMIASVAGRIFLYGEPLSFRTLLKSV
jgi:menaquinone-9 beta-reductase